MVKDNEKTFEDEDLAKDDDDGGLRDN